jgi:hypothetical protein
MTRSLSSLRTSFVSIIALAGGGLVTGCVDAVEPITDSTEHAIVQQEGTAPYAPVGTIRIEGDRVSQETPGWTQTAPGLWTGSSGGVSGSIVVGAEGHRLAIARAEKELARLRASGDSSEAIERQEAYLDRLEATAELIPPPTGEQSLICNIQFVFGPSSPLIPGFIGAFAGAQLSCIDGVQVFTVQAQACTNIGCGPVGTFTPVIGAAPQLFGVARAGTAGAACFGIAAVTPPGVVQSANGPCG